MTVGELKAALAALPDDAVLIANVTREARVELQLGRWVPTEQLWYDPVATPWRPEPGVLAQERVAVLIDVLRERLPGEAEREAQARTAYERSRGSDLVVDAGGHGHELPQSVTIGRGI